MGECKICGHMRLLPQICGVRLITKKKFITFSLKNVYLRSIYNCTVFHSASVRIYTTILVGWMPTKTLTWIFTLQGRKVVLNGAPRILILF